MAIRTRSGWGTWMRPGGAISRLTRSAGTADTQASHGFGAPPRSRGLPPRPAEIHPEVLARLGSVKSRHRPGIPVRWLRFQDSNSEMSLTGWSTILWRACPNWAVPASARTSERLDCPRTRFQARYGPPVPGAERRATPRPVALAPLIHIVILGRSATSAPSL